MGSYLSVHNDTPYTAYVSLGPDTAALKIAGICFAVVAGVASAGAFTFVTVGTVLGAVASSAAGVGSMGMAVAAPTSLVAAGAIASAASLGMQVGADLEAKGMVKLLPGCTHRFGKMSLSLMQQANVTLLHPNPHDRREIIVDTTVMRPIFSGPTDGSDRQHNINWWLGKWGADRVVMKAN